MRSRDPTAVLERIKRVVADYPDAPEDIEDYAWVTVPRYWESVTVPGSGPNGARITPLHEDQHGGVAFRVGWLVRERVAAVWFL